MAQAEEVVAQAEEGVAQAEEGVAWTLSREWHKLSRSS